jgi:hypothetical protein
MYGDNAFHMQPTVFQSDLDAAKKQKQIDFADLEARARDYAKVRCTFPLLLPHFCCLLQAA